MCVHACAQSRLFAIPLTIAHQTPLSMEFSRQEHWRGLPFPTPGDLPNPIELESLASPVLAGGFFTTGPPGKTGIQRLVGELRSLKLQTVWQGHKKKSNRNRIINTENKQVVARGHGERKK